MDQSEMESGRREQISKVHKELKVKRARKVSLVHRVQVQEGKKVRRVIEESAERKVKQASAVQMVRKVQRAQQVRQDQLAPLALQAQQVQRVQLAQLDQRVQMAQRDQRVQLDLLVQQDHAVKRERQELLDQRGLPGHLRFRS